MKNRNKIVFINILSTILIQGIAFIASPIYSRLLGTENYGIVSLYHTWSVIVSNIFSLQVNSTLHMARAKYPLELQDKYQSSTMGLGTVCYLLFSGLCLLFLDPLSALLKMDKLMIIIMIVFSFGQFCVSFLNAKYTYEFKAGKNFVLSMVTSVCSVVLSVLLIIQIPSEINYWGRIIGEAITYVLLAVIACIILFSKGKTFFNKEFWLYALPLGLPLVFHTLSNTLLGQSDRVMLQQLGDESMVGIYSLAATFSLVLNLVYCGLNNSWAPFYLEYSRTGQIEELKMRAKNYMELFTVLACGFVLLTTEVYHLFADKSFWDGTSLVFLLAIGYYMVFLYSFAVNYEFFRQKTKMVATGTIIAALCNVVLNYFFIKSWGYFGAALATAIAHTIQFLIHYAFARHIGKDDFPFKMKDFLPYTSVFLVVALFSMATPDWALVRWILGAAFGIWELYRLFKRKSIF